MNDPDRLLGQCPDELELELLRSWRLEHPSPAAFRRTARALGLMAAPVALSATAGAGAAASASALGPMTASTIVKWCAVGALCGAALTGGTSLTLSVLERSSSPGPLPSATVASRNSLGPAPRGQGPAAVGSVRETMTSGAAAAPDRPLPSLSVSGPVESMPSAGSTTDQASIAEEIALLDRARAALRRNDPERALIELERLATHPGSGTFTPEAMLVRIEALGQSGRKVEARELARRFTRVYPQSPSAPTVQRWIEMR